MVSSRREFIASAALLAAPFSVTALAVACSLEESRCAYRGLPLFAGKVSSRLVLVESGAGFADENLGWLKDWNIKVHDPEPVRGPAWVKFDWPIPVMIRDFARVCRVSGGSVIARLGDTPVAVRKGPLIVLGSPLGPSLYSGDRQAHQLLNSLLSVSQNPPMRL